ncbi:MAG TPA: lipid-A-disaccharide synthase N-terminal domain-containing protein [Geobacteraceae bacterium]|nr:lipid-A-disaccharide synthase N-terminal domain-containing protein [Geobacteraceae bacterium]
MKSLDLWLVVGFAGQALFTMRFIVQWISSERQRRSVVPTAFWYFSLAGGVTILAYALHRKDPVFIVGQSAGVFIYLRNLHMILRQQKAPAKPSTDHKPGPPDNGGSGYAI